MTVAAIPTSEPRARLWTRDEYYRLAEEGYFRGQRVLLMEGEIIQMPPMGHEHAVGVTRATRWLSEYCKDELVLRVQMPLNALEDSDPEPDLAVIPGPLEAYRDHPKTALLIIEVADSSLPLDRKKAFVYAAIGVEDYWILDLKHRCFEVYRNPRPDPQAPHGFRYDQPVIVKEGETIAPLAIPSAAISPKELLT
jgi:Uma2 family endonuclease